MEPASQEGNLVTVTNADVGYMNCLFAFRFLILTVVQSRIIRQYMIY